MNPVRRRIQIVRLAPQQFQVYEPILGGEANVQRSAEWGRRQVRERGGGGRGGGGGRQEIHVGTARCGARRRSRQGE